MEQLEFRYDTQVLLEGERLPIDDIKKRLSKEPEGDCLLVVGSEEMIKIHFHTNHPWKVLEYLSQFGPLHDIVIENMEDQQEDFET